MNIQFRLINGIRFELNLQPSVTIGQIKAAFMKNSIIKSNNIRFLFKSRYLNELVEVGSLSFSPKDFILCHGEIDYSKLIILPENQQNRHEEIQHEGNEEEDENFGVSEASRNTLSEMGISFEEALIALGLAQGSPERAAQLLYNLRRVQNAVDFAVSTTAQEEHIRQFIDSRANRPLSNEDEHNENNENENHQQEQQQQQIENENNENVNHEQQQEQEQHVEMNQQRQERAVEAPQHEISNENQIQQQQNQQQQQQRLPRLSQSTQHQEIYNRPPASQNQQQQQRLSTSQQQQSVLRNSSPSHLIINQRQPNRPNLQHSQQTQTNLSSTAPITTVTRSHSPIHQTSNSNGRSPLHIQQTLAVQRTPISEQPLPPVRPQVTAQELHNQRVLQQQQQQEQQQQQIQDNSQEDQQNVSPENDANDDDDLTSIRLIRTIRDDPQSFPRIVALVDTLDHDFAMGIRENPEGFLLRCNLSPENYNCEEVRFIPPEFRYLNASIRKSIKNIIKKSKQQGLIEVMSLLKESGHNFDLPIKRNPEGFIHALGLNPSDYDLDVIRLDNTPRVSDVIDSLTQDEQVELRRLTNVGFSVPTVLDTFERCNHNAKQARNILMST